MKKYEIANSEMKARVDKQIGKLYGNISENERKKILKDSLERFKDDWKELVYSADEIKNGSYKFNFNFPYYEINDLIDEFATSINTAYNGGKNINIAGEYKETLSKGTLIYKGEDEDRSEEFGHEVTFMDDLFNHTLEDALERKTHKIDTLMYFHKYEKGNSKNGSGRVTTNCSSFEFFNESLNKLISEMKQKNGLAENLIRDILEEISENILEKDFVKEMYDIELNYGYDMDAVVGVADDLLGQLETIMEYKTDIEEYLKNDTQTLCMNAFNTPSTPNTLLNKIASGKIFDGYGENGDKYTNVFILEGDRIGFWNEDKGEGQSYGVLVNLSERAKEEKQQQEEFER